MDLARAVEIWASVYGNSPVIRTTVEFAHIAGLVVGAGWAITTDRAVLGASPTDVANQRVRLTHVRTSHRYVIAGLTLLVLSGLLLLAADADTYLHSRVFWTKMGGIGLLAVNGAWLHRASQRAETHPHAWTALRRSAAFSLVLWTAVTFLGAALPNVS